MGAPPLPVRRATHVCVVVVANGDVDALRRLVRSFCLRGQRRWHFVHERDSRRRQILDAVVASGQVTALIYYGKGRDTEIRAESFRRMVDPLIDRSVARLIIESREGRDELDRQVLVGRLRGRRDAFLCDHMPPHGDPLLWIADAPRLVLVSRRTLARTHRRDHHFPGR